MNDVGPSVSGIHLALGLCPVQLHLGGLGLDFYRQLVAALGLLLLPEIYVATLDLISPWFVDSSLSLSS